MAQIILLLCTLISFDATAGVGKLLKCLGKEEAYLHKNYITGPIYHLNQKWISKLSGVSDITVIKKIDSDLCTDIEKSSPSVSLLKEMILNDSNIYVIKSGDENLAIKNAVDEIYQQLPEIFVSFLADIQSMLETPKCLIKKIPEISYFQDRFKYLQTDLDQKNLFDDHKKIEQIFEKLNKIPSLVNECKKKTAPMKK